jgi:NitT/TauT family transport system permease protein
VNRSRRVAGHLLPTVIAFGLLFGLWEAAVAVWDVKRLVLPPPSAIVADIWRNPGYWVHHAWVTGQEAVAGFVLALAVSLVLAVAIVHSRLAERALLPVLTMVQVTPIIALAVPLFILFRSFGLGPKIVMSALVVFIPFTVNAIAGLRAIDPDTLEVLRSVDASRREVLLRLRLPHALPYLFAAARVCIGLALIGALVAEWSGSSEGLGYVMVTGQRQFATTAVWAAVFVLTAMGLVGVALVGWAERRLLRWHPTAAPR